MKNIEIRKAEESDLERIADIFIEEYGREPYNEKWPKERALEQAKVYYKNNWVYVASVEKEIVGFVVFNTYLDYDGLGGFIEQAMVSERAQGRGFGKSLIRFAEEELKKLGVERISCYIHKKSKAIQICENLGYIRGGHISFLKELK